ncbi:MAG: four helix bundle protein [Eubacterium sp.]
MKDSKLITYSMDLSVKIVKLCNNLKGQSVLKNQLIRSATSIGANIREASYAQSKADFISKMQIALKECYETEYWLEIFVNAEILPNDKIKPFLDLCGTIRRMLIASINTAKTTQ